MQQSQLLQEESEDAGSRASRRPQKVTFKICSLRLAAFVYDFLSRFQIILLILQGSREVFETILNPLKMKM